MISYAQKPYHQLPAILFLFIQMLSLGTYIVFFLITFLTFETQFFLQRSEVFYQAVRHIVLLGTLSMLVLGLFIYYPRYSGGRELPILRPHGREETRWYALFVGGMASILLVRFLDVDLHLISFLVFLGAISYLFHLARFFSLSADRPAWEHPTTAGAIIEGSSLLGLSIALWFLRDSQLQRMLMSILLAFFILEILTLWARFRFLSKHHAITRKTVRMLLGSHLALFGVRFIFGLIMPLVYLSWVLFISPDIPHHPLILMVIVGELSERVLFFITSHPRPVLPEAEPDKENVSGENHESQGSPEHRS